MLTKQEQSSTEQIKNGYGMDMEQIRNGNGNTCGTETMCSVKRSLLGFFWSVLYLELKHIFKEFEELRNKHQEYLWLKAMISSFRLQKGLNQRPPDSLAWIHVKQNCANKHYRQVYHRVVHLQNENIVSSTECIAY